MTSLTPPSTSRIDSPGQFQGSLLVRPYFQCLFVLSSGVEFRKLIPISGNGFRPIYEDLRIKSTIPDCKYWVSCRLSWLKNCVSPIKVLSKGVIKWLPTKGIIRGIGFGGGEGGRSKYSLFFHDIPRVLLGFIHFGYKVWRYLLLIMQNGSGSEGNWGNAVWVPLISSRGLPGEICKYRGTTNLLIPQRNDSATGKKRMKSQKRNMTRGGTPRVRQTERRKKYMPR